jgi:hypothetical protein
MVAQNRCKSSRSVSQWRMARVAECLRQAKLEAQYVARQQGHAAEVQDLKQQIELKGNEIRSLNSTIDSLKGVNDELKVRRLSKPSHS